MSESVSAKVDQLKANFVSGATRSLEWRLAQLKILQKLTIDNKEQWLAALKSDLGKTSTEADLSELVTLEGEIAHAINHVASWMSDTPLSSSAALVPAFTRVRAEPRGVALIIGPSNYPLNITLGPLVGALSAGCPALLKPSELCPATSDRIASLVPKYFGPEVVSVVEGGVDEVKNLLSRPWGTIFFTGSTRVGKIVAEAGAKTLTPCVLELGGKNPVIVCDDGVDLSIMARRLIWAKTFNAGQSCISPDYVLCTSQKLLEALAKALVAEIEATYGKTAEVMRTKSDLGRLVSTSVCATLGASCSRVHRPHRHLHPYTASTPQTLADTCSRTHSAA